MPGVTMPPPLAPGPYAPPAVPPQDPLARVFLRRTIQHRMIGASATMALGVLSLVFCWLSPVGLLFGLMVVIMYGFQVRLVDYDAGYFWPEDFPDRGALKVGFVLGAIGSCLSAVIGLGWIFVLAGGRP